MVRVDSEVLTAFLSNKPKYLSITGFVSLTLKEVADAKNGLGTVYLQGLKDSTAEEQPAVDVKPKAEPTNKEKTVRASKSPRTSSPLLTTFLKS